MVENGASAFIAHEHHLQCFDIGNKPLAEGI